LTSCRLATFGSNALSASRQLLLELLPAAAASASTPHRQLLVQLLQGAVASMCDKQSLGVDIVLQVLHYLPLVKGELHEKMLKIAYRDGELTDHNMYLIHDILVIIQGCNCVVGCVLNHFTIYTLCHCLILIYVLVPLIIYFYDICVSVCF
jgi:hypothetical protein